MTGGRWRKPTYLGAALAVLGAAAWAAIALRDRTPLLTRDAFERAKRDWQSRALADYDITVRKEVDARPTERLRTDVRGGRAARLLVNGNPVPVRDSYSVQGLFEVIEGELEMASSRTPVAGQPQGAILRAHFHESLGVPLVVKRIAPRRQSYVLSVEKIEVPGRQVVWEER